LQRLSAILLITVFAWSQYAKQAIYLECRLSNTFKIFAVKCDCETKAGFDKPDTNNLPLSKTHTHIHLDELFPVVKAGYPDFSITPLLAVKQKPENDDDCEGRYDKPFEPPRA
jgi:hypothetical protein